MISQPLRKTSIWHKEHKNGYEINRGALRAEAGCRVKFGGSGAGVQGVP